MDKLSIFDDFWSPYNWNQSIVHWVCIFCSTIKFYMVSNSWIFGPTKCHPLDHMETEHLKCKKEKFGMQNSLLLFALS